MRVFMAGEKARKVAAAELIAKSAAAADAAREAAAAAKPDERKTAQELMEEMELLRRKLDAAVADAEAAREVGPALAEFEHRVIGFHLTRETLFFFLLQRSSSPKALTW